jgi:hydrogenase maturation protease
MPGRILVAGIGNVFFGDDGFGVEVARRLAIEGVPDCVRAADFGIRGIHLAYELLDGAYDLVVFVDAAARGGAPGTVYLIEPDLAAAGTVAAPDAHGMTPDAVLGTVRALGGNLGRVLVVGCEPESSDERLGLSAAVSRAVPEAIALVRQLIEGRPAEAGHVSRNSRTDHGTHGMQ